MAGIEYPVRPTIDLGRGWEFVRERADCGWLSGGGHAGEQVDLPHCWNARDAFQEGVAYYRGYGSYRRSLAVDALPRGAASNWILRSEGFYGLADILVNGRSVAEVDGQYLGFGIDTTPFLTPGAEHMLGIRLTNRCPRRVLPGIDMPDFLLYGGLSGRVWLEARPHVFLDMPQTRIVTSRADGGNWRVDIRAAIGNASGRPRRATIRWTLSPDAGDGGATGPTCEGSVRVAAGGWGEIHSTLLVAEPDLWSPAAPALYALRGDLSEDNGCKDAVHLRIGFREAEFRPDQGFFLNGERLPLRGCNRHESMPGLGRALPAALHRRDAAAIRQLGLNFVRLSHYPQHPAFLDACDELGLLVYAEIATWKSVRSRGPWLRAACRQMATMVTRDRHRPCVILWGMGNESQSRRAYLHLRGVVEREDPSRPVTYAENHLYRARRRGTLGVPDVWGANYELDELEAGCDASRLRSVVVSECSNYPDAVRGDPAAEARQVEMIHRDLAVVEDRAFVAGFALWCFNDYATLRKRRYIRYSGIVDAWRRPKFAASYLRARYTSEPVVDCVVDWAARADSAPRRIVIATNCSAVRILYDGEQHATLDGGPLISAQIPFRPVRLEVEGRRGDAVAIARVDPWGPATHIAVTRDPELTETPAGQAGCCVRVADKEGRICRDWAGRLRVATSGPGHVHCYTADNEVRIAGGIGWVFVSGTGPGTHMIVEVSGGGLAPGRLEIARRE